MPDSVLKGFFWAWTGFAVAFGALFTALLYRAGVL